LEGCSDRCFEKLLIVKDVEFVKQIVGMGVLVLTTEKYKYTIVSIAMNAT